MTVIDRARQRLTIDQQHALCTRVGLDTNDQAVTVEQWQHLHVLVDAIATGRARWCNDFVTGRLAVVLVDEPDPAITEARWRAHVASRGIGNAQIDGLLDHAGGLSAAVLLTRRIGTPRGVIWDPARGRWVRPATHLPESPR